MKKIVTLIAFVALTISTTAQNVHDWQDVHVYTDRGIDPIALSKISKISHVKNAAGTTTDVKIERQDGVNQYKLSNVKKVEMPVQIGQYLFSDGTWGDLQEGKVPIAVIFSNVTTEADAAKGWTHGYAMALHKARNLNNGGFSLVWGPKGTDNEYLDNWDSGYPGYPDGTFGNDREGYTETHAIPDDKLGTYPAFEAARKFWLGGENYQVAPEGTSGWFLPSTGLIFDILVNLGGLPSVNVNNVKGGFTYSNGGTDKNYNISWQKNVGPASDQMAASLVKDNINKYLMPASVYAGFEADKNYIEDNDSYWTSTERNASAAFWVYIGNNGNGWVQILARNDQSKEDVKNVRPIIAF